MQELRKLDLFKSPGVAEIDRLGDARCRSSNTLDLDPKTHQRHAGRAAQVPGRHPAPAGLGSGRDPAQGEVRHRRPAAGLSARVHGRAARPPEPRRGRARAGARRQARHQHRAFRPHLARGRPAGRAGQVLRAIEAVEAAGLKKRDDFYWTLHSVFVNRRDQREIFDQAFHVYWRNPRLLEKMMEMLLPQVGVPADPDKKQGAQPPPAGGAVSRARARRRRARSEPPEVELEATFTVSDREVLQHRDFEQMSQAEIDEALRAIARLRLPVPRAPHPPLPAGPPRPARRLPRLAAPGAAAGGPDRAAQARAAPPAAAAGDPVRHLRLDGPLHAHVPAFHARDHQRPRPGLLLHLRHAAQQRHPRAAQQGRRHRAGKRPRRRSRTGPAARASARPCTSSTTSGRAGCWARAPSCC